MARWRDCGRALPTPESVLVSGRQEPYSRSKELIPYLSWHVAAARAQLGQTCERLGLPTLPRFREQNPSLSPRESDFSWAKLALAKGMPQEQVLRAVALQGSRAKAADAPRAVAYAARVLSSALRSTLSFGPDAAAAATLHALGSAISLARGGPQACTDWGDGRSPSRRGHVAGRDRFYEVSSPPPSFVSIHRNPAQRFWDPLRLDLPRGKNWRAVPAGRTSVLPRGKFGGRDRFCGDR